MLNRLIIGALLAASLQISCATTDSESTSAHPAPTERGPGDESDADKGERRRAWFEERHRSAPEFDWRSAERKNARNALAKHNSLAALGTASAASRWTERGSDNLAGRMHAAAHGSDGRLYAGSSRGGVWNATLDGQDWQPMGDQLFGGSHWLVTLPPDTPGGPEVVLRATDGGEVHVTRDGGTTWLRPEGLPQAKAVRRVIKRNDGSNTVLLLADVGSGPAAQYQLFRSTDHAVSFEFSYQMGSYPGDLWASRIGAGPIYLFNTGLLYRSDNNGVSWNWTFASFPTGTLGMEMTGSEAGAPRLWVIAKLPDGTHQLYRSDNAGFAWTFVSNVSDYWGSLSASITDADVFAWGGVEVHRTTNGSTFSVVNNWWEYYDNEATKLHADVPGIDVVPGGPNGEIWYIATDGGLYRSFDQLATVENISLEGLRVSQYYSTLTSVVDPNHVAAGAQDQGYQWAGQPPSGGETVLDFDQVISGDYGHLTSGDGSHSLVYSCYPGFVLAHFGETNPSVTQINFPDDETMAWIPPVVADTTAPDNFFLCASRLWYYDRVGTLTLWTNSLWSTFDFGANNGEYVSALEFSPIDPTRAFVITNYGRLFYSTDRGVNWTQSASNGPGGQYFYGTAMHASEADSQTVWVAGSGYGSPAVYRSVDGGVTYSPWSTGLPDTLVYSLGEAPDGSGALFCGTETGAYRRDPSWPAWFEITGREAPVNTYWSVEPLPAANAMRFGTYGRGIWDYSVADTCTWDVMGADIGGSHTLALDATTGTQTGAVQEFVLSGAAPGATGFLLWSFGLGYIEALGGTVLVNPPHLIPIAADTNGNYTLPLFIPAGFEGVPLVLQGALFDTANENWNFSNALRGVFCP